MSVGAFIADRPRLPAALTHRWIYIASIVCLLMLTLLKNDAAAFANSEFWSEYSNSPLTVVLKGNAWGLAGLASVFLGISFLRLKQIWMFPSVPILFFLFIYFFGFLRGLIGEPAFSGKMALGFAVIATLHILFSSIHRKGAYLLEIVNQALHVAAFLIVGLNLLELLNGNGFVPGNVRFFGVGGHPNFTGVHMALCVLILSGSLWDGTKIHRIVTAAFLLAAAYLLYLTGSRTGLVVMAGGMVATLVTLKMRYSSLLLLLVASIVGILILSFSDFHFETLVSSEVYDRGGGNTRSAAWAAMWGLVLENPLIGSGQFVGNSENSVLRGWAAIGIIYPIALVSAIAALALEVFKQGTGSIGRRFASLFALMGGLVCGSVFEGYLIDSFSFPLVIWCICLSTVSILVQARVMRRPVRKMSL